MNIVMDGIGFPVVVFFFGENHYENKPMQYMYTEIIFVVKMKIFTGKILIFFLFLLKT